MKEDWKKVNRNLRDNIKIAVTKHKVTGVLDGRKERMKQKIYLKI